MNKIYPGKPNYTGPKKGWFTLLHHEGPLLEWSDDVMERIEYIKTLKVGSERPIRLRHIVFFPESKWSKKMKEANAKRQEAAAKWHEACDNWQEANAKWHEAYEANAKWHEAYDNWQEANAKRQEADAKWHEANADKILAYLKEHVKDCKWNGKEIVFT